MKVIIMWILLVIASNIWLNMKFKGISGITDTDDIQFCPKCGSDDLDRFSDGTARCCECEYKFGVVECEDEGV